MDKSRIEKNMVRGKRARLFPVLPESKKEEKATSILLAVFQAVPDLAREVLGDAGAPVGKRSQITCFTEVSFKGASSKSRPDGLIVISNGGREWVALVESKVGRSDLTVQQVEEYLDLAKEQGFDAVLTISNQFAALPSHHPLKVNKTKTRSASLFHFSWLSIISRSILLIDSKTVDDVEQSYILQEMIRFLEDEASGVSSGVRMSTCWRDTCEMVHKGTLLKKSDNSVVEAVAEWHQLIRYLSIQLSIKLGQPCTAWMPRKHIADPVARLADDVGAVVAKNEMTASLEIPNAVGRVNVTVSLIRKTLDVSVNVETPKDVKQQRAAINFVLSQLKNSTSEDLIVRVNWPRRVASTELPLHIALEEENRKSLIPENFKELPSSIDLLRVVDLGGKLKTSNGLPEIAEGEITRFYQEAVQGLEKWVPKAPKVKQTASHAATSAESESIVGVLDSATAFTPNPFMINIFSD